MAKDFKFRGYGVEELKDMSISEFSELCRSKERRTLKRGFTKAQKKLLKNIKEKPEKFHKTHERDLVIIPQMLGVRMGIHNGKDWITIDITPEKLGYRLGEFVMTRERVQHSAPGVGASRSTKFVSIK